MSVKWQLPRIQLTANDGEDVLKGGHVYTVGGINWYNHFGNQSGDFTKY